MRRAVVIGSGNATHADGRAHTAIGVESSSGERILLDAGATTLHRLRRPGASPFERSFPERLDAILISHFHGDHVLGLPVLLLHLSSDLARRRPLVIGGPPGIEQRCRRLFELAFPGLGPAFELRFLEFGDAPRSIGAVTVRAHPVTHRPESLAYRLTGPSGTTVAYSGDAAFDERLIAAVRGADLAFVELSLLRPSDPPLPHVSLEELRAHPGALDARRIVFVHVDDAVARALREADPGRAAADGDVIDL